jgi:phospholipase/carboxylesterase
MTAFNRRDFLQSITAAAVATTLGCAGRKPDAEVPDIARALLKSRPRSPSSKPATGLRPLGLSDARDGFIYVPPTYSAQTPSPLLLLLHGAGQSSREWSRAPLSEILDKDRIVAVIPDSRFMTWDMIYDDYGPDVIFLDKALALAFRQCRIDPKRIAIGGFSDGATYALSLGITNADLFSTILAFSPGTVRPAAKRGKPRIFIGHGRQDQILPIDQTSREIVAALREKNYPLKYEEFDGRHTMTKDEINHAIDWFMER